MMVSLVCFYAKVSRLVRLSGLFLRQSPCQDGVQAGVHVGVLLSKLGVLSVVSLSLSHLSLPLEASGTLPLSLSEISLSPVVLGCLALVSGISWSSLVLELWMYLFLCSDILLPHPPLPPSLT